MSTADKFYRIGDMMPPQAVVVRLIWSGWQGRGAWALINGVVRWFEMNHRNERIAELPPAWCYDKRGRMHDGQESPQLWAPLVPDKWAMPLPPAAPAPVLSYWSERQSFGAVDDAEAADLAREMEHDREAARAGRETTAVDRAMRRQWWRDETRISRAPGVVQLYDAEGRVMRALAVGVHERAAHGLGYGNSAVSRMAVSEGSTLDPDHVPFEATPRDHDDYLTASEWFNAVALENPMYAAVLEYAADERCFSWRRINSLMGYRANGAANQLYREAILTVWLIANGRETPGVQAKRLALEAVQESNRAHKRKAG